MIPFSTRVFNFCIGNHVFNLIIQSKQQGVSPRAETKFKLKTLQQKGSVKIFSTDLIIFSKYVNIIKRAINDHYPRPNNTELDFSYFEI